MLEQLRARMPASGSKTMPKCDPTDPLKDSLVREARACGATWHAVNIR